MATLAFILCIAITTVTAIGLYRKLNPQGVLLLSGLLMLTLSVLLGLPSAITLTKPTGCTLFDLVKVVEETSISNLARAGLMIMTIGGYVAFMNHIQATHALVYISMKPLRFFRKYPYLTATVAIPIGQMLFITTPSAAGLGLLLVAAIYPVLVNLGVSKLTALSVIAAATLFDQGPGSANTAMAAELIGETNVAYFLMHQLPVVLPTTCVVMLLFYLNNRYCDRKLQLETAAERGMEERTLREKEGSIIEKGYAEEKKLEEKEGAKTERQSAQESRVREEERIETEKSHSEEKRQKANGEEEEQRNLTEDKRNLTEEKSKRMPDQSEVSSEVSRPEVPLFFALLPIFPLTLLIVCSPYVGLIHPAIHLTTTTAMLFSLILSLLCVAIQKRSLKKTFESFGAFWKGMGNVFSSVVTLIIASEVFSKGLISLGFIDSLIDYSAHIGLSGQLIVALFALIIFGAAMLMGSGNAAFFSFGPLLPDIATQLGMTAVALILPLQLAASMGRAASPIAGVIVAIAGVAGVSPIDLAKRNTLPLVGGILFLLIYHLLTAL